MVGAAPVPKAAANALEVGIGVVDCASIAAMVVAAIWDCAIACSGLAPLASAATRALLEATAVGVAAAVNNACAVTGVDSASPVACAGVAAPGLVAAAAICCTACVPWAIAALGEAPDASACDTWLLNAAVAAEAGMPALATAEAASFAAWTTELGLPVASEAAAAPAELVLVATLTADELTPLTGTLAGATVGEALIEAT